MYKVQFLTQNDGWITRQAGFASREEAEQWLKSVKIAALAFRIVEVKE